MKKALFISLIWVSCLNTPGVAFAQGNFPFPNTYAEWSYHTVSPVIGPNDDFYFHKNILSGDTVFQGKHYTKLMGSTLCTCTCTSVNGTYAPYNNQTFYLQGGLREEAGKVYFTRFGLPPHNDFYRPVVDTLLFDFTLKLGDTLLYDGFKLTVTGIEFTPEGRRVEIIQTIKPNGAPKMFRWVEGIGGPFGPLETRYWIKDYIYYDGNSCFTQDLPGGCPEPCVVTSDTDFPENQAGISIYPSFAQDFVTVSIDKSFGRCRLFIYANDGRLLNSFTPESSGYQVPMAELPGGVLHFVFENASGQRISKSYIH